MPKIKAAAESLSRRAGLGEEGGRSRYDNIAGYEGGGEEGGGASLPRYLAIIYAIKCVGTFWGGGGGLFQ